MDRKPSCLTTHCKIPLLQALWEDSPLTTHGVYTEFEMIRNRDRMINHKRKWVLRSFCVAKLRSPKLRVAGRTSEKTLNHQTGDKSETEPRVWTPQESHFPTQINKFTPLKTNMSPKKRTISIGNTSSNHCFSRDKLIFGGVHSISASYCKSLTSMFGPFWVGFPCNHYLFGWPTGGEQSLQKLSRFNVFVVFFPHFEAPPFFTEARESNRYSQR